MWVAGIGSNTHAMYLLLIFGRVHSTDLYLCIYTHNNIGKQAIAEQGHSLGLTLRYFCEEVKAEEVEVEYEVEVEFEDDF